MSNALRVLLVDDDEVDRLAVRRLLKQTRFDAELEERDGRAAALEVLSPGSFDCVLLDYNLPGADGIEILKEIAVELMKAGAADYLNKNSLTAERLERSLRYALALHRADEERRQLLEREQRAREEAQTANRAKDEFLATLSHELRTPLNAILGWARLLASGNLDEATARRAIEVIDRNTRLQAQLIEDLLDISRIITGKLRLDLAMVPVGRVIDAALEAVRPSADLKRITISSELHNAEELILCDPARMQQVIWNLLSNAIKFTPEGGSIHVGTERVDEAAVLIGVRDSGIGIAPDFLPFVFDRFRQQDGASTRAHGGLGLGLSIVRHVTELHGGTVEAHSDGEGRGAMFSVRVPLAPIRAGQTRLNEADTDTTAAGEQPSLEGAFPRSGSVRVPRF
jgi:signal transduction histidine kinase